MMLHCEGRVVHVIKGSWSSQDEMPSEEMDHRIFLLPSEQSRGFYCEGLFLAHYNKGLINGVSCVFFHLHTDPLELS